MAEKSSYKIKILRQTQIDGKIVKVGTVVEVDKTTRDILLGSNKATEDMDAHIPEKLAKPGGKR